MSHGLTVLAALVVGFYLLSFLLALGEKEHLAGDLLPADFSALNWRSDYLADRFQAAGQLGLVPCGDFFTSPHASIVKGPMRLFRTTDGEAIVALICARFLSLELKKTVVRTRISSECVIETSDGTGLADITGGIDRQTILGATVEELLQAHRERLDRAQVKPERVSTEQAFRLYEKIDLERGHRLVALGLARWTDPAQTKIRRSFRGALLMVRANQAQRRKIVAEELATRKKRGQNPDGE